MAKMTFSNVAPTGITKYIAPGSVDVNGFTVGFLTVGKSTNGTDVLKPTSLKAFKEENAERYETKSAAAKDFYRNLRLFTSAAQADFNKHVTDGHRVMMVRKSESGRRTYTLAEPKLETGGPNNEGNAKLESENTKLKAQLAKMMSVLKTAGLLEENVEA
jgi:hypothetical protein